MIVLRINAKYKALHTWEVTETLKHVFLFFPFLCLAALFFQTYYHAFGKLRKFQSEGAAMFVKGFNHSIIYGAERNWRRGQCPTLRKRLSYDSSLL